jgi:hypothetical protein
MAKSRGFRANATITEQSNSFALFGDDDLVRVDTKPIDPELQDVEKNTKGKPAEQDRSQAADEEPDKPQRGDKEAGRHPTRGFRSVKEHQSDHTTEGASSIDKGENNTDYGGKVGRSGKKEQGVSGHHKGSVGKERGTKRKVQKDEGGSTVQQGEASSGETINFSKYTLRDFEETDRAQIYSITGNPKKTKDPFIVEVIIEGFRYKVSPWSIKDGQYFQGLDSNFLVRKLRIGSQNRRR